jgi:hypothetical protein
MRARRRASYCNRIQVIGVRKQPVSFEDYLNPNNSIWNIKVESGGIRLLPFSP